MFRKDFSIKIIALLLNRGSRICIMYELYMYRCLVSNICTAQSFLYICTYMYIISCCCCTKCRVAVSVTCTGFLISLIKNASRSNELREANRKEKGRKAFSFLSLVRHSCIRAKSHETQRKRTKLNSRRTSKESIARVL